MRRNHAVAKLLPVILLSCMTTTVFAAGWNTNSLELYQGSNYAFNEDFRRNLKFSHSSSWNYGENNIFFEVINPDRRNTIVYGEYNPALSLSKIFKRTIGIYPIVDTLIAGQIYWDELGNREYAMGLSTYLDTPPQLRLKYLQIGLYHQKDPAIPKSTYSLQAATQVNIHRDWFGTLFVDYVPKRQSTKERYIQVKSAVYHDIGRGFYRRNVFYLGVGYHYWNNKLGFTDVNESVWTIRMRMYL